MPMHNLGQTRSSIKRDHFLLTPDTFIRTPLPGLTNGVAIVHVAPAAGAAFTQMTVELEPGGTLTEGPTQRLLYVLEGKLTLSIEGSRKLHKLAPGGYAYIPSEHTHTLTAVTAARIAVIDKPFLPLESEPNPEFLIGREQDLPAAPLGGDPDLIVRSLLPASMAFDFACNTMTYAPGAALSQVEVHYMEHGLLMLEGGGIYRLGDQWYPTTAGDFIWMAPYCPQWFGAIGKKPAKYLIYKDFNRYSLL
ncbi:(S)-ureidoglycine aminohydrolase [Granulicella paludicola]|uniref:(S)-ureidoglycine aminohydrolase n=1 Tax=Granulicella paludicola TaxID=474951 RepID=UPI0021E00735|nr:(S)-ureidoglycine aminohydrolase [Granulicella paludicola]